MELFGRLFGVPSSNRTSGSRGAQRPDRGDQFRTKMAHTEHTQAQRAKKIEADMKAAKRKAYDANKEGKKEEARIHLRRAALLQNQLKTLYGYGANNAVLASQAESTQMALDNVELMKEGAEYQKGMMAEMGDVLDVEETMGEVQDVMEQGQEIIKAVSTPFDLGGIMPDLDDDALDAAMDELEEEMDMDFKEQLAGVEIPERPTPLIATVANSNAEPAQRQAILSGGHGIASMHTSSPSPSPSASSHSSTHTSRTPTKQAPVKSRYASSLALLDD